MNGLINRVVKHASTDYDNSTYDTGRTLAVFVVVAAVLLCAFDVVVHKAHFDAQAYGTGIGGILVGLGIYLFGDRSGQPQLPGREVTVKSEVKTTSTIPSVDNKG